MPNKSRIQSNLKRIGAKDTRIECSLHQANHKEQEEGGGRNKEMGEFNDTYRQKIFLYKYVFSQPLKTTFGYKGIKSMAYSILQSLKMVRQKRHKNKSGLAFQIFIILLKFIAAAASITLLLSPLIPLEKLRLKRWSCLRWPI